MNIAIIGVGGVGGYFGSKMVLAKREEDSIYFIARGEHLQKIRENGLVVKGKSNEKTICYPTLATSEIDELPELDLCLICVKGYDLTKVLKQLQGKIKDSTDIVPLLNGVDIYDRVRKIIKNAYVYPACVYIGTYIEEPGVIRQNGGQCKIIFGKDFIKQESEAQEIQEYFNKAGIDYSWTSQYREAIWNKYMCVASYALVTAAYDKTMGEVYADKALSQKVLGIMGVIFELAKKNGVCLSEDSIYNAYEKVTEYPYETKTSFQRDYERKREKDERDIFGGTILELAEKYGVDDKVVQEVYQLL
jgi:2-dehydropantoate 2-reductase